MMKLVQYSILLIIIIGAIYYLFQKENKEIVLLIPDKNPIKIRSSPPKESSIKDKEFYHILTNTLNNNNNVELSIPPEKPILIDTDIINKIIFNINKSQNDDKENKIDTPPKKKQCFLHLLSLRNPNLARSAWQNLKIKYIFLSKYKYEIQKIKLEFGNIYYLLIGPFSKLNEPKNICTKLINNKHQFCSFYYK